LRTNFVGDDFGIEEGSVRKIALHFGQAHAELESIELRRHHKA
jgi:hypothetical protein